MVWLDSSTEVPLFTIIPEEALNLNANFLQCIVSVLHKLALTKCHLFQISTPAVYGRKEKDLDKYWREGDLTNPLSIYAQSKLLAELILSEYNGPKTIIRSDIYGINSHSEKSLLWWIIRNAHEGNKMEWKTQIQ